MSKYEKLITAREPEYDKSFWNYARGNVKEAEHLEGGRNFAGAFELPTFHANQCAEAIKELSLFRKIASCAYAAGSENWIAVKDSEEFAVWVPEGGDIPVYDGMYDFTSLKMDYNKLVALGTAASGDTETLTAYAILCDDVEVGTTDDVTVPVYLAGCFNLNKCVTINDHTITEAEKDALRNGGIFFKAAAPAL